MIHVSSILRSCSILKWGGFSPTRAPPEMITDLKTPLGSVPVPFLLDQLKQQSGTFTVCHGFSPMDDRWFSTQTSVEEGDFPPLCVAGKAVMRRMVLISNVAAPDLRCSGMIHTYCLDLLRRLSSIHELIGISGFIPFFEVSHYGLDDHNPCNWYKYACKYSLYMFI